VKLGALIDEVENTEVQSSVVFGTHWQNRSQLQNSKLLTL